MLLCDQYLHEYFLIDPTINDFFLKDEWTKKNKRGIQPNIYSEKYYKDSLNLNKKYLKILKDKELLKRTFDFVVAAAVLVLLSPVFLILAFIILIKMGWPILFSQVRPGLGGKPFRLSKFRTMKNTEDGAGNLLSDGERITALGRFLRRTSVDELPELFNVLKGDMSLVGPRPLLMEYLPYYDTDQERRHTVRPGMTGLAQVNGRNDLTWEEKFELDVWYVDNRSLWLDLKILCRTVWIVFTGQGVSAPGHDSMPRFDEIMARTQGAEDV